MNVELTIQEMFDDYPSICKERSDCLDHLFCHIGNGYFWENGELIDGIERDDDEIALLKNRLVGGKAFQHNKLSLRAEHILAHKEWMKTHPDDPVAPDNWFERYPDDVYYKLPRKQRWYFAESRGFNSKGNVTIPQNLYLDLAYMWNFPEDIKPDWLEAIEETKRLLEEDGFILPIRK